MVFVVGAAGRDQRAALGVENEMVGRNLGHERSGQPVRARDSSEMTGSWSQEDDSCTVLKMMMQWIDVLLKPMFYLNRYFFL